MRTHKIGLAVAAFAVLVSTAACSSDGSKSSAATSPKADAASAAANLTGTPIKIMVTGTFNGPGIGYPEATAGASAAADAINGAGGVDGHPVKVITCDDHFDANQASGCAQKAVSENVAAIVGGVEFFGAQILPGLDTAKIPWVAPVVVSQPQYTSPMSFPVDGGGVIPQVAMGREAVRRGGKNVVIVSIDSAGALANAVQLEAGVKAEGGHISDLVKYPPGTVDFSSTSASVMSHKPDAVLCLCSSQVDWSSLYKSLTQAGFDGPFSTSVTFITKDILKTLGSSAKNVFLVDGQRPFDADVAEMAQYKSEINQYAPKSAVRNQILGDSWLGVHVIADALKGSAAVDASALVNALTTKPDFPTYGLVQKIDFRGSAPNPTYPRIFNVGQMTSEYDSSKNKVVPTTADFFDPFATSN